MLIKILLLSISFDTSAFVVPADPWDPPLATDLLEALYRKGVAVQRAVDPFEANGKRYPAGTRIVPASPYLDAISIEMGVPLEPVNLPASARLEPITKFHAEGSFRGQGKMTTLDHRDNSAFIATAFLLDRFEGVSWTADGTVILHSWYADGFARAENFSKQFVVRVTLTDDPAVKPLYELHRPRVALLNPPTWLTNLMDENTAPYETPPAAAPQFETVVSVGAADFAEFLNHGGTVIQLPEQLGAPRKMSIDTANPIAFGMPPETRVFASPGPFSGEVVARFDNGAPALTVETVGKGRRIVFHFRPQPGTVKLLLNAIYLASATKLN
jgi:hypothetical protein